MAGIYRNCKMLCALHPTRTTEKLRMCLNTSMFVVANISGFQHVMNFLLNILKADLCKQAYWWPICDKSMESKFRRGVYAILLELRLEYPHADFLSDNISASFLSNPGGPRFSVFMDNLSHFVLQCSLNALPDAPRTLPFAWIRPRSENTRIHSSLLRAAAASEREDYQRTVALTPKIQAAAEEQARTLSMQLTATWSDIKRLESKLKEYSTKNRGEAIEHPGYRSNCSELLDKIKGASTAMASSYGALQSAVATAKSSPHCLDGSKLRLNLTEKHFSISHQMKRLSSRLSVDNKLDLTTVLSLASECVSSVWSAEKNKLQAFSRTSSRTTLDALSRDLDQNATTTSGMYSELATLIPTVHHNIDNFVSHSNKLPDNQMSLLMDKVSHFVSPPPFLFDVDDIPNPTTDVADRHTLHLTPDPNRLKNKLSKYKFTDLTMQTPDKNRPLGSSSNVSCRTVISKLVATGLKASAIPRYKRHASVFAKYGLGHFINSLGSSAAVHSSFDDLQSSTQEQNLGAGDTNIQTRFTVNNQPLFSPLNDSVKSSSLFEISPPYFEAPSPTDTYTKVNGSDDSVSEVTPLQQWKDQQFEEANNAVTRKELNRCDDEEVNVDKHPVFADGYISNIDSNIPDIVVSNTPVRRVARRLPSAVSSESSPSTPDFNSDLDLSIQSDVSIIGVSVDSIVMSPESCPRSSNGWESAQRQVTPAQRQVTPAQELVTPAQRQVTPALELVTPAQELVTPARSNTLSLNPSNPRRSIDRIIERYRRVKLMSNNNCQLTEEGEY